MRRLLVPAALVLIAAACGAGDDATRGDTLSPPATSTTTIVDGDASSTTIAITTITTITTTTAEPGTRPDDEPVAPPEDVQDTRDDAPIRRLSISDALLLDDTFDAPWEFQRRELDRAGYPSGPNQTDCDEYWEFESLLSRDGGQAMWWVDGGNATHHVIRMADETEIFAALIQIGTIAESCPTVTWNEGGSFATELFDFDDAFGLRFDDAASGEVTWVLATTFGDLVSVLRMPLWTPAGGPLAEPSGDELARLASRMYERLVAAGAAEETVVVSTTEPPPVVEPPDPPVDVTGVGELLLGENDLPEGWVLDRIEAYTPSPTDQELVDECPAATSIDRVDAELQWEADYDSVLGSNAFELIGEMDSADEASATIEEFSTVWECDFGVLLEGATTSGGPVVLTGADAAGRLVLEAPDLLGARAELVLAAIGNVVIVVSEEIAAGGTSSVIELAQLAVDKIVDAG